MIMTILPQPFELEQFDYLSRKKDFQKGLVISHTTHWTSHKHDLDVFWTIDLKKLEEN